LLKNADTNKEKKMEESVKQDDVENENPTKKGETPVLKVKADPPDLPDDERKIRVKKLAGAISHALRSHGEVNVRGLGPTAIGKSAKALSIAQKYLKDRDSNLRLETSPAFISVDIGDKKITGIAFYTFAVESSEEVNLDDVKGVLKVKADPDDISAEDKKRASKALASAIAHVLEEDKEVVVRAIGDSCISKASKALAIARGLVASKGPDLYCWPKHIVADMGSGNERTGIAFYAYTNDI
jgi:stage V sporulation protein SpoVS